MYCLSLWHSKDIIGDGFSIYSELQCSRWHVFSECRIWASLVKLNFMSTNLSISLLDRLKFIRSFIELNEVRSILYSETCFGIVWAPRCQYADLLVQFLHTRCYLESQVIVSHTLFHWFNDSNSEFKNLKLYLKCRLDAWNDSVVLVVYISFDWDRVRSNIFLLTTTDFECVIVSWYCQEVRYWLPQIGYLTIRHSQEESVRDWPTTVRLLSSIIPCELNLFFALHVWVW